MSHLKLTICDQAGTIFENSNPLNISKTDYVFPEVEDFWKVCSYEGYTPKTVCETSNNE